MSKKSFAIRLLIILAIALTTLQSASAAKDTTGYQTGMHGWRAAGGDFAGWALSGVTLPAGALLFDNAYAADETDPYPAGGYYEGNFYTGGSYRVGQALSPVMTTAFGFKEAIASWNAVTPPGSWIEVLIQARFGTRWTKWYNLGIWAADDSTISRHSVRLQGDGDGYVAVDTLVLTDKKTAADAYQLKVRLFSVDGTAIPSVQNMSLAYSTSAPKKAPAVSAGNPALWNTSINVPECSQMVYPDGGNVWCSPTSTSMVVSYWENYIGPCEPAVRAAVAGVYDWIYDGHGNWPFNTAYAGGPGYEAYVARFTSLDQVEPWVAAGVPVVFSYAWGKKDLTGAAIPSSDGHLSVIVGFDEDGNPIVNDPAAATNEDVQRTYLRAELEALWLTNSGGTVYLIYPAGHTTPPF
jgi:hypothetical protein